MVRRVGDETFGEVWSLYGGQDVPNELDPQFSANIRNHVARAIELDPFHAARQSLKKTG